MWFNSRRTEEPHQGLTCYRSSERKLSGIRKDGSTGAAWLSSARSVRSALKWDNERNPRPVLEMSQETAPPIRRGGRRGRRQVSMALMPWATHMLQWEGQRALPHRKVERIPQTFPKLGFRSATRPHERGIGSNRRSVMPR